LWRRWNRSAAPANLATKFLPRATVRRTRADMDSPVTTIATTADSKVATGSVAVDAVGKQPLHRRIRKTLTDNQGGRGNSPSHFYFEALGRYRPTRISHLYEIPYPIPFGLLLVSVVAMINASKANPKPSPPKGGSGRTCCNMLLEHDVIRLFSQILFSVRRLNEGISPRFQPRRRRISGSPSQPWPPSKFWKTACCFLQQSAARSSQKPR
jgi:hypothetical protein